jgi:hypothetical protein
VRPCAVSAGRRRDSNATDRDPCRQRCFERLDHRSRGGGGAMAPPLAIAWGGADRPLGPPRRLSTGLTGRSGLRRVGCTRQGRTAQGVARVDFRRTRRAQLRGDGALGLRQARLGGDHPPALCPPHRSTSRRERARRPMAVPWAAGQPGRGRLARRARSRGPRASMAGEARSAVVGCPRESGPDRPPERWSRRWWATAPGAPGPLVRPQAQHGYDRGAVSCARASPRAARPSMPASRA